MGLFVSILVKFGFLMLFSAVIDGLGDSWVYFVEFQDILFVFGGFGWFRGRSWGYLGMFWEVSGYFGKFRLFKVVCELC